MQRVLSVFLIFLVLQTGFAQSGQPVAGISQTVMPGQVAAASFALPKAELAYPQQAYPAPQDKWKAEEGQSGGATTPAPKAKKSNKTTWIVIGCLAAGAVAGLLMLEKRLNNEGGSIF